MSTVKIAQVNSQLIPIDDLYEIPDNPNEQDKITFENLVMDVSEDGFTQALEVVPRSVFSPLLDGYFVVSGNHRLRAVKRLQVEAVDCVVHNHWDAETALVKVVRRNMVHGKQNPEKFSKLVDRLNGYTHDQLADVMGFETIDAFASLYERQSHFGSSKTEDPVANLIDGLNIIINQMFTEYGDTVMHSFMFFLYGKKVHLTVLTSPRLKNVLNRFTKKCVVENLDLADMMAVFIERGMETIDDGSVSSDDIAKLVGVDELVSVDFE